MTRSMDRLKIFTGNAHPKLAEAIAQHLGKPLASAEVGRFPDGENKVLITEPAGVRGDTCFIIQPTCPPVDMNLTELLILIRAVKGSGARRIIPVIPYYGFGRQERKDEVRVPITAKLVAQQIETAGATQVLLCDLHVGPIQGFFDCKADHVYARPVVLEELARDPLADFETIIGPDIGAMKMVFAYASRSGKMVGMVGKLRLDESHTKAEFLMADPKVYQDKRVCLLDDMASTCGTISEAAKLLLDKGAASVDVIAIHPVMIGPAFGRLASDNIRHIWVTDTIPLEARIPPDFPREKITIISVARLLAEAIYQIYIDGQVSPLFEVDAYLRAIRQAEEERGRYI